MRSFRRVYPIRSIKAALISILILTMDQMITYNMTGVFHNYELTEIYHQTLFAQRLSKMEGGHPLRSISNISYTAISNILFANITI